MACCSDHLPTRPPPFLASVLPRFGLSGKSQVEELGPNIGLVSYLLCDLRQVTSPL